MNNQHELIKLGFILAAMCPITFILYMINLYYLEKLFDENNWLYKFLLSKLVMVFYILSFIFFFSLTLSSTIWWLNNHQILLK